MTLWIGEEGERQAELRDLGGRDNRAAAQFFGLLKRGRRVVHLDVEGNLAGPAVLRGPDPAADTLLSRGDKTVARPVTSVVDLPTEKAAIELLQLRSIPARNFEPRTAGCAIVLPSLD
jgi:hypothetical protein